MRHSIRFCECPQDGHCPRYRREMRGRFREICAGVNVDLGTAAAFREQWTREVTIQPAVSGTNTAMPLLLKTNQAPGDAVAMTAAIYSLHKTYPGKYLTAVESPYPEVFDYNPDIVLSESILNAAEIQMHYPAIHRSNHRGIHFMQGWCEFLGTALGVPLPLMTNRPHLFFRGDTPPLADFWIICSGGKRDFTNKLWGHERYQEVVDRLKGKVQFVQVGSKTDDHPKLSGAYHMLGATNLRQLFDLVRRARGVLCGVSLLMHVAAALEKPAIVIAGGREPVQWNAYPLQHYLHTVGMLPCSDPQGYTGGACWRSRVVPLGDNTSLDKDTCIYPTDKVPKCMSLISPSIVTELILTLTSLATKY